MNINAPSILQEELTAMLLQQNVSCTSIIVTLFGDVVSQHGEWIWLGSIIDALSPLGFNERSVRTSVFRLVQNDWLVTKKIGRKSYYCFTERARSHYERAERRIYHTSHSDWDTHWILVLNISIPEEKLEDFRKSIRWLGFNILSPGLFAHPSPDRRSLDEMLIENKLTSSVAVFKAQSNDVCSKAVLKELITDKWQVDTLADLYQNFLDTFREVAKYTDIAELNDTDSFAFRLTVLHEFRRIQLKDPDLPPELLPIGWVGFESQDLLQRVYKNLTPGSLFFIQNKLFNAHGELPSPSLSFYNRFSDPINSMDTV
ncbi:MAG: phenylacetic acid degradation operon negative regulatory protein [Bermanella sp.]|jgi:phenylacetic acid degradation operon negative regulatory protein|uniref:PaaX family transcriptional regulator n=1 Tax=Glaciecola sp. 33A TaxID=2057807 RepID=UPI000C329D97|nr:PaaX family transcriptional regulator C-terminal domain-containing protein [Glaciecola sp. 33A]PKI02062.1 phenylacetic acid degradation operon negative regulatory protein PaaX [Glaciecola sp. 33A]